MVFDFWVKVIFVCFPSVKYFFQQKILTHEKFLQRQTVPPPSVPKKEADIIIVNFIVLLSLLSLFY